VSKVGIIANPASGKDIRRLVAYGSVFDNQEKVNIVRRALLGLEAAGVEEILYMPDYYNIVPRALDSIHLRMDVEPLDMPCEGNQNDSTRAAELLEEKGAKCIVVLGGDGTNRTVAKGSTAVPFMPISTGTNNVFPFMVESTIAGLAAGFLATGIVSVDEATSVTKRLDILLDGEVVDLALIDVALYDDIFVGAKAIWDMSKVKEITLTQAKPSNIGLSSVGGVLLEEGLSQNQGLHIRLGSHMEEGRIEITAPVAPGFVRSVYVDAFDVIEVGDVVEFEAAPAVLALDGEREVEILPNQIAAARLSDHGPRVVNIEKTMRLAVQRGRFKANNIKRKEE